MIDPKLKSVFIEELENVLNDIKHDVSRSIILIATKGSSGTAQDIVRVAVTPKDRLPTAYLLSRLVAGLIGSDESSVEIPYPLK